MPLRTTAPSPSCWSLARIFLRTKRGAAKGDERSDSDMAEEAAAERKKENLEGTMAGNLETEAVIMN